MNWMLEPYRRYADFSGRSRRMEYWMFMLLYLVVAGIRILLETEEMGRRLQNNFQHGRPEAAPLFVTAIMVACGLFGLISLIPSFAVGVRRLHDIDRSGWWLLLILVPVLGWGVLFVFHLLDGTPGDNRFGADPKGRGVADVFS